MRCHASICRWSPFFGICGVEVERRERMHDVGRKALVIDVDAPGLSASQCASSPSPSEETMPMPVIQTSDLRWAHCADRLQRASRSCLAIASMCMRKASFGNGARLKVSQRCTSGPCRRGPFSLGDRKAGALVLELGLERQHLDRADEAAHLGFLDGGKERHPLEFTRRGSSQPDALRHGLDQQHAGHERAAGEVAFEDRAVSAGTCASTTIVLPSRSRSTMRSMSWK